MCGGHRLDPLELGLTGGCEPPVMGTEFGFFARALNDFNSCSLSPWFSVCFVLFLFYFVFDIGYCCVALADLTM